MPRLQWFFIFVAVHGLFLVAVSISISMLRIKYRISYGDGDNTLLRKAIRIHVNGIEQVPIFGLLILALALMGISETVMAVLVVLFTAARLSHGYGMLRKRRLFRQFCAAFTYLSQITAIVLVATLLVV